MTWWILLSSLVQHLATVLPTAIILMGAENQIPSTTTVRVKRGFNDQAWPIHRLKATGIDVILIECWVCNQNSLTAYQALAALEMAIIAALRIWKVSGYVLVDITVTEEPDGDLFRPAVGSQLNVRVEWRLADI